MINSDLLGSVRVAAVIVTFNRLDKLKKTLDKTLTLPFSNIVVVNNASTDGTECWLSALVDPRLRIVQESQNRGGAGGFSRGFEEVINHTSADWLVCFDDDAYPDSEALTSFAKLVRNLPENVGGVAAAVFLPDGRISTMNRPGINPFKSFSHILHAFYKRHNRFGLADSAYCDNKPCDVDYSSFVGFFVRCNLVRTKLGLPRSELFIYADDIIYTYGLKRRGYRLIFDPSIHFVHDCETLIDQQRIYYPLWKAYYTFRNGLAFYRQLSGAYFYPIMLPILLLSWLGPARHYPDRKRFLRLARIAICDGLRGDFSKSHREVMRLASD